MDATDLAALTPAALVERRREVLEAPALDGLPAGDRVELDLDGDLIASPRPANRPPIVATLALDPRCNALDGFASAAELGLSTSIGVRMPDGFWGADAAPWAASGPAPVSSRLPLLADDPPPPLRRRR